MPDLKWVSETQVAILKAEKKKTQKALLLAIVKGDQKSKVMKCREKERRPLGGNIRGNCVGAPRLRSFVSTGNTGSYG